MTVKINADTTDGLKFVSDTSGTVDIQSNGTTKLSVGTTIDLQGNELVLDADADTSIHASTDDQIDFKTGGTDRLSISSAGKVTSTSTGAGSNFQIESTATGSVGADLTLYQDSVSPADNDIISLISFAGNDSGGTKTTYAQIRGTANDVSDTTEDGMITFFTTGGGTLAERMRIDSDGFVGIGVTTTQAHLHVDSEDVGSIFGRACIAATTADPTGDSLNQLYVAAFTGDSNVTNATFLSMRDSDGEIGNITANGASSVAYNTSSDYRLKENVDYAFDATTRLKQLKPCRFNFIADPDTTKDGFLAHEVSSIVPEAVTGTHDETRECVNVVKKADGKMIHENVSEEDWTQGKADGTYAEDTTWSATATVPRYQGIDQSKLVPLLVKTIQELEARITALENN